LVVIVALVVDGGELFVILNVPRMIPGAIHKRSSLRFFGSINGIVSGIKFLMLPFRKFL
jgi:hypothetical protein